MRKRFGAPSVSAPWGCRSSRRPVPMARRDFWVCRQRMCAPIPPTMLVSIDKRTSALQAVLESRHFAINYLARDQQELADIFGGKSALKGADRFSTAVWGALSSGAPVLQDAAGAIDCVLEEAIERFGVVIAIGRVVDFRTSTSDPLIFFRGRYISTPPKAEAGR